MTINFHFEGDSQMDIRKIITYFPSRNGLALLQGFELTSIGFGIYFRFNIYFMTVKMETLLKTRY